LPELGVLKIHLLSKNKYDLHAFILYRPYQGGTLGIFRVSERFGGSFRKEGNSIEGKAGNEGWEK
jgi:hypothetical protein